MNIEHWWNDSESGKLKYSKKNLSRATLFTKTRTCTGLQLNLGLSGDRPVSNLLHHSMALICFFVNTT